MLVLTAYALCVFTYAVYNNSLHHHPDMWVKPEKFRPERWLGSDLTEPFDRWYNQHTQSQQQRDSSSTAKIDSSSSSRKSSSGTDSSGKGSINSTRSTSSGNSSSSNSSASSSSSSSVQSPHRAGAFLPFAAGPRGCVGQPFAMISLRVLLARLCRDFDAQLIGAANKEMQAGFTVLPAGGLRLQLVPWAAEQC
jgi:cytochrome P450